MMSYDPHYVTHVAWFNSGTSLFLNNAKPLCKQKWTDLPYLQRTTPQDYHWYPMDICRYVVQLPRHIELLFHSHQIYSRLWSSQLSLYTKANQLVIILWKTVCQVN